LLGPEEQGVVADEEGDGEDEQVAPLLSVREGFAGRQAVKDEDEAGEEESDACGEKGWNRVNDDADRQKRGSPEDVDGRVGS
jgi:hypothetical protein